MPFPAKSDTLSLILATIPTPTAGHREITFLRTRSLRAPLNVNGGWVRRLRNPPVSAFRRSGKPEPEMASPPGLQSRRWLHTELCARPAPMALGSFASCIHLDAPHFREEIKRIEALYQSCAGPLSLGTFRTSGVEASSCRPIAAGWGFAPLDPADLDCGARRYRIISYGWATPVIARTSTRTANSSPTGDLFGFGTRCDFGINLADYPNSARQLHSAGDRMHATSASRPLRTKGLDTAPWYTMPTLHPLFIFDPPVWLPQAGAPPAASDLS